MEDTALIDLYWQRDETAIEATAAKYGGLCGSIARNILKAPEDCEECLNDTYFAVWNAIPEQRPGRFSVFVSRITRNLALKKWEYLSAAKRNPAAVISLEELGDCVSGTAESFSRIPIFCPFPIRYSAYFFKKVVFPAPKKPVIRSIFTKMIVSSLLSFSIYPVLCFLFLYFNVIYYTFS